MEVKIGSVDHLAFHFFLTADKYNSSFSRSYDTLVFNQRKLEVWLGTDDIDGGAGGGIPQTLMKARNKNKKLP